MTTDKKLVEWFEHLYNSGAIYLWGANGEVIDGKLTNKLFAWFGSKTYDKKYFESKLESGEGKIGADCSGAFKPVSGFDLTAEGYYGRCVKSGSIAKIPHDKVCQVFKRSLSGKITHIGLYCGNGCTIEMKSSKDNVHKEKLNKFRWTYYGIPDWVEYVNPYPTPTRTVKFGCQGDAVKWVQWELVKNGWKISIDGDFGNQTLSAVEEYQKKHGLAIDGLVGPKTRATMMK